MEAGGLAPPRRNTSPNPQLPSASSGTSSPNYEGEASSTNSQASIVLRENEYSLLTLPPTTLGHAYIVQMPRDQIFRVPPPENANIVKRVSKPLAKKKSQRSFKACLPVYLYALILLFMILGLSLVILQLFLKPQNPEFSVENMIFRNSTRPEYDISLIVKNTNKNLYTIIYEGAEDASVVYRGKSLAEGAFPAFEQGPNGARNVMVSCSSLKRNSLPADLEKSLLEKKKIAALKFTLMMEMPVRSKLLSVIPAFRGSELSVKCEFTIDSLATRAKILSQKCGTFVR